LLQHSLLPDFADCQALTQPSVRQQWPGEQAAARGGLPFVVRQSTVGYRPRRVVSKSGGRESRRCRQAGGRYSLTQRHDWQGARWRKGGRRLAFPPAVGAGGASSSLGLGNAPESSRFWLLLVGRRL